MTPADIQRLRQQQMFGGDITSGGIMGGIMGDMGGGDYEQSDSPQPGPMDEAVPMIRSREIIGPSNVPTPPPPAAPQAPQVGAAGGNNMQQLIDLTNQIYTPSTVDRDRYRGLLDAAPVREEPDWTRRLVASGMGINAKDPAQAIAVMEGTMYAPHIREMQDWTAKTQPFGQAAQYENTANVNERTLAGNLATNLTNQQRYDQQNAVAEEKNRIAEYRAESERILRNAQAYMQNLGKGFKPITVGTTIKMYNESTGEIVETGMSTDKMNEEAKITLQNLGRVNAAAAIGQNAATVAGINQSQLYVDSKGQYYLLNPAQAADAATMGLRPISPGATPFPQGGMTAVPGARGTTNGGVNTPTEQRAERNQKFLEFADKRPDLAAKWLIQPLTATGNWGIKPPPIAKGLPFFKSIDPNEMNEYNMVREELGLPPMPGNQPIGGSNTVPGQTQGQGQTQQQSQWQTVDPGGINTRPPASVASGPVAAEDKTRADIRARVAASHVNENPRRQEELELLLANPNTPEQIKPMIVRELEQLSEAAAHPTRDQVAAEISTGTRLKLTNPQDGSDGGSIPNTPEAIAEATRRGWRVEVK